MLRRPAIEATPVPRRLRRRLCGHRAPGVPKRPGTHGCRAHPRTGEPDGAAARGVALLSRPVSSPNLRQRSVELPGRQRVHRPARLITAPKAWRWWRRGASRVRRGTPGRADDVRARPARCRAARRCPDRAPGEFSGGLLREQQSRTRRPPTSRREDGTRGDPARPRWGVEPALPTQPSRAYRAVITVLIPPRGVKSPTTVMRSGAHAATNVSRISLVTLS